MTLPTLLRAAWIGALVFLARTATAQIVLEEKAPLDKRIDCLISVPQEAWRNNADTRIHVHLKNRINEILETEFNATLDLIPRSKLQRDGFWSPIDLAHDMPAPTDRQENGGGVSIELKMQALRIEPGGEVEFNIHAANMKWALETSSGWPDFDLKIVPAGDYSIKLTLDTTAGSKESNAIKVVIVKESRAESKT
jgi:hypothetical protein